MEARLAELLGEPATEAVVVSPCHAGLAGLDPGDTPIARMIRAVQGHCGYLYLVSGVSRVALFPFEGGSIRAVRGPALLECPRDTIAHVAVQDHGLTRRVTLEFRDGHWLELDVPRSQSGRLGRLVEHLAAA
ncbi:MAG: hypothetical protein U5Q44_13755 [Dehalococcoidia bacterium]|nr:hypothetical protein [Dehalococcoidia bacterium]